MFFSYKFQFSLNLPLCFRGHCKLYIISTQTLDHKIIQYGDISVTWDNTRVQNELLNGV